MQKTKFLKDSRFDFLSYSEYKKHIIRVFGSFFKVQGYLSKIWSDLIPLSYFKKYAIDSCVGCFDDVFIYNHIKRSLLQPRCAQSLDLCSH